jgi:hypothetical protein
MVRDNLYDYINETDELSSGLSTWVLTFAMVYGLKRLIYKLVAFLLFS